MQPQHWRALQVTLDTAEIPPEDDVSMAQGSSSIVYHKYMKVASSSDSYNKQLEMRNVKKNQLFHSKVKALEAEKDKLQNLFSMGKSKQGTVEIFTLFK